MAHEPAGSHFTPQYQQENPDLIFFKIYDIFSERISLGQVYATPSEARGLSNPDEITAKFNRLFEFEFKDLVEDRKKNIIANVIKKIKSFEYLNREQSLRLIQLEALHALVNTYGLAKSEIKATKDYVDDLLASKSKIMEKYENWKNMKKAMNLLRLELDHYRDSFSVIEGTRIPDFKKKWLEMSEECPEPVRECFDSFVIKMEKHLDELVDLMRYMAKMGTKIESQWVEEKHVLQGMLKTFQEAKKELGSRTEEIAATAEKVRYIEQQWNQFRGPI